MDDQAFLYAFEDGTLPHSEFGHRGHIRMAWLYLRAYDWDEGVIHIRTCIQHFAAAHGTTTKYHETITLFWAHVVHHMLTDQPHIDHFDDFLAHFPQILDSHLIERHYSVDLLHSPLARSSLSSRILSCCRQLNCLKIFA